MAKKAQSKSPEEIETQEVDVQVQKTLNDAEVQAKQIIAKAEEDAKEIVTQAQKDADELLDIAKEKLNEDQAQNEAENKELLAAGVFASENGNQYVFEAHCPKKFRFKGQLKTQKEWLQDSISMEMLIAGNSTLLKMKR